MKAGERNATPLSSGSKGTSSFSAVGEGAAPKMFALLYSYALTKAFIW